MGDVPELFDYTALGFRISEISGVAYEEFFSGPLGYRSLPAFKWHALLRISIASAFLSGLVICGVRGTCLSIWGSRRSNGCAWNLCYIFSGNISLDGLDDHSRPENWEWPSLATFYNCEILQFKLILISMIIVVLRTGCGPP